MPDITMCKGYNCPKKEKCFRHKAVPTEYWQSYFAENPYDYEIDNCLYFIEILITDKVKKDD